MNKLLEQINVKSIRIVFVKSPSRHYKEVIESVDSLPADFKKSFENKTHCIEFQPKALEENYKKIETILSSINKWKSTKFYINDKSFESYELNLIFNALRCMKNRSEAYNCDEYCKNNSYGMCHCLSGFNKLSFDDEVVDSISQKELISYKLEKLSNYLMCPYVDLDIVKINVQNALQAIPIEPDLSRFDEEYDSKKCDAMFAELEHPKIGLYFSNPDEAKQKQLEEIKLLLKCNEPLDIKSDGVECLNFDKEFLKNNFEVIYNLAYEELFDFSCNGKDVYSYYFHKMLECYKNYLKHPTDSCLYCCDTKTEEDPMTGEVLVWENNCSGCPYIGLSCLPEQNMNKLCFDYCRSAIGMAICPNYDLSKLKFKFEQILAAQTSYKKY